MDAGNSRTRSEVGPNPTLDQRRPRRAATGERGGRSALAVLAALTALAALIGTLAISGSAGAAGIVRLQQRIHSGQSRVSGLAGSVHADSQRIGALNTGIAALQGRLTRIEADLNARIARLRQVQDEYQAAHTRLVALEGYQAHAEAVLRRQLIGGYESPQPDLMTVILESRGFQSLLDQLRFMSQIRHQDARVVTAVRATRRAVAAQATRLGALQLREQTLVSQILVERTSLARAQAALVGQRTGVSRSRAVRAAELAGARAQLVVLRDQLSRLQAQQAAAAAAAARRAAAANPPAGTGSSGSGSGASGVSSSSPVSAPVSAGGFTFPLPRSAAAPPGSWSLDQGVDISAPGGTPEYAVCSGTIVLHGIGGFGPWAPVLHCDGSLGGYAYVYYGHAGPANQLPVGTHVSAGQVMSEVGPGIVGISSGPHVEMGFSDASGTPIGGGSASVMMSLLRSAYGA